MQIVELAHITLPKIGQAIQIVQVMMALQALMPFLCAAHVVVDVYLNIIDMIVALLIQE